MTDPVARLRELSDAATPDYLRGLLNGDGAMATCSTRWALLNSTGWPSDAQERRAAAREAPVGLLPVRNPQMHARRFAQRIVQTVIPRVASRVRIAAPNVATSKVVSGVSNIAPAYAR